MSSKFAKILSAALIVSTVALSAPMSADAAMSRRNGNTEGVIRVKSAYSLPETVERVKADLATKGIMFFTVLDQSKLAAEAGIQLRPSSLIMFGNPALGSHFITSNPNAGLDWPVRLLVYENASGQVWAAYTDFAYIARRHRITNRKAQFAMASKVIASITSSVAAKP
jgi:uncharacterized protein (DUF302 family)